MQDNFLNRLAAECHAANQHWWHNPATGERLDRNKDELLMLIVSELAEAMEGERKDLLDDKLPHRKMAEVELADTIIRILDCAGVFRINFDNYPARLASLNSIASFAFQHHYNLRTENKAAALFWIVKAVAIGDLNLALWRIFAYAGAHAYDLDGAVKEKRAYNAQRPDHKAEARLAANGKKW